MQHSLGYSLGGDHFLPRRVRPELAPDVGVGRSGEQRKNANSLLAQVFAQRLRKSHRAIL